MSHFVHFCSQSDNYYRFESTDNRMYKKTLLELPLVQLTKNKIYSGQDDQTFAI